MAYTATVQSSSIDIDNLSALNVKVLFDDGQGSTFARIYNVPNTDTADDIQARIQEDLGVVNASATALDKISTAVASIEV